MRKREFHEQRELAIHKKCREDGVAKCLSMFESDWLDKVTDEEKLNMASDECLSEKAKNRKIRMLCDFKIDNSGKPVFIDSYKTNYTTIKEVVETLRNQQEPDIGALIPMVD